MNDSISIKQAVELLEQDGLLVGYDCPPQLLEHRFLHSCAKTRLNLKRGSFTKLHLSWQQLG